MIFSVTPKSSSISSVVGCKEAARWSSTGAGSCSNTVTGTPILLSDSAQTMPTGPAPTMTTRAFDFDIAMPDMLPRLVLLQLKGRHDVVPDLGVRGEELLELARGRQQRLQSDIREPLRELLRLAALDQRIR